jgi:hypothetical protein
MSVGKNLSAAADSLLLHCIYGERSSSEFFGDAEDNIKDT